MTDEVLTQANNVKARIKEIDSLLKQIEPTNTATGDKRIVPICIQAGINNPVEFYIGGDIEDPFMDVDNAMYDQLLRLLKAYKSQAETIFASI